MTGNLWLGSRARLADQCLAAVAGPVAWGAAGFQFGGDRVFRLLVRRIVVKLKQFRALAIDALVVVGFEDHAFLACGWVPATV